MVFRIIAFSNNGIKIIERISKKISEKIKLNAYYKFDADLSAKHINPEYVTDIDSWVKEGFNNKEAVVFVGALGIAVRSIAGYVNDKMTDSPVIVIDDAGTFVIPVLSGHVGGANKLADYIASILGATCVITTSTDVNNAFSPDTFAMENNLSVVNKSKIKKVSSKAIEGKPVVIAVKDYNGSDADIIIDCDYMNNENIKDSYYQEIDSLILKKKKLILGIGLKKGNTFEKVESLCRKVLTLQNASFNDVYAIASIDVKMDEEALEKLAAKYNLPRIFFDADMLNKVKGEFTASQFVKDTVGVDNVCERAALLAAGNGGTIIVGKTAMDGVTVAIAKKS